MAEIRGELVICDRCGMSAFALPGKEGGYDHPEGWHTASIGYRYHLNFCPKCWDEYNKVVNDFFNDDVRDSNKGKLWSEGERK